MNMVSKKGWIPGTLLMAYLAVACMYGCGESNPHAAVAAAESRYSQLSDPKSAEKASQKDMTAATQDLADAYVAFADAQPDAPETPDRLYKAGELYQINLLDINKSIEMYDRILVDYPDHRRAANALFTKAYVYHNTMNDLDRAKGYYEQFIAQFPDHELAVAAQFELDNLGLPAEQVLERIQAKPDTVSE